MARFKTRARTVEMLGRQQIAGIPTAISELFKNAHDAYADVVEVDFYRPESLFVLRDNGLGMTIDEFESRWLALGTESKLTDAGGLIGIADSLGLSPRQVLGEKGIGRLAIGAIGPQVLICTRAKRSAGLTNTVVAFINWSMFTIPGVNIEDVEIPVTTLKDSTVPSGHLVAELVGIARSNLMHLHSDFRVPTEYLDIILRQLNSFTVDPGALAARLGRPSLEGDGHGTHFYVSPVSGDLPLDIDADQDDRASQLSKMLIGFSNTMVPDHALPVIAAEFRDHKSPGIMDSLIAERTFFTSEDFASADHMIRGEVDEYGQFNGTVTLYGSAPIDHSVPWNQSHGRPTECGPFRIDLAYAQGNQRDSRLPPDRFNEITKKLNLFGGIYIYRDGIRVLPYGNQDYDFLRIEERRNKSASYYYFSYRRLFGVLSISQRYNANLVEKAGREGFQENLAYRQFKDILERFFIQTASSFFRADTPQGEPFAERRSALQRREDIARKREQEVRVRRRKLETDLDTWFHKAASGEMDKSVEAVITDLRRELESLGSQTPNAVIDGVLRAEERAYGRLAELREQYRVTQPRGIGLPRNLRRDMEAYKAERSRVETQLLQPAEVVIAHEIGSFSESLDAALNRRRRLEHSSQNAVDGIKHDIRRLSDLTRKALDDVNSRVKTTLSQSSRDLDNALNGILADVQRERLISDTDAGLADTRQAIEAKLDELSSEKSHLLETVSLQLASVIIPDGKSNDFVSQLDLTEATEEELLTLRETVDTYVELAHLGGAVEAINHEFQTAVIAIRDGLRDLESWARVNERLGDLYQRLETAFEHLDRYLSLLTPLTRRANRALVEIAGSEIEEFLKDLFGNRLNREQVELSATGEFGDAVLHGYRSTFYPVFMNLVDNAIFWLVDQPLPRRILLHLVGESMAVSDTGPGIAVRDRQAIFESGFTRKPNGRGLGLHISQETLQRDGYVLSLVSEGLLGGATFTIDQVEEAK